MRQRLAVALLLSLTVFMATGCGPKREADKPSIVLRCPAGDAVFAPGDLIPLRAEVHGLSQPVVEFTSDEKVIARRDAAPFAAPFRPELGSHILQASARDAEGILIQSQKVLIRVDFLGLEYQEMDVWDYGTGLTTEGPDVQLLSPASGTVLCHPARITFTAQAKGIRSPVVRVEFLANGVPIGVSTVAPYSCSWERPPLHRYVVKVVATDADGRFGQSFRANLLIIN
jgi:chitinase